MIQLLNGTNWQVKGYWPHEPLLFSSMETGGRFKGVTDWLPACVPGDIHQDLLAAGYIEDPNFENNSVKCEWVANRWWVYRTTFPTPTGPASRQTRLIFKGVDYRYHVYLNDKKLGTHEGMFTPFARDVSDLLAAEGGVNHLHVVVEAAPREMSQIGYTSRTLTQKSRFNYKWDFCSRLVSMGIWNDVILESTGPIRLGDASVSGCPQGDLATVSARMEVHGQVAGSELQAELSFRGQVLGRKNIAVPETGSSVQVAFEVEKPELWWPNGYGGQPLYELNVTLLHAGAVSDQRAFRVGIRSLSYKQCPGGPQDSLPYTPVINGRAIYLRGVNFTPDDHLPGVVDAARYEQKLRLIRNMNANLVRVWGGGVIEKEAFYELCDRLGLLVWQEFIQSSSGIDNSPSKDAGFLNLLRATAETAVREKRNHVSLTFWSGGNELTSEHNRPSTCDDENLAMLKAIVTEQDPLRLFLPTSASGPREFLNTSPEGLGTNHDVHGSWKYEGAEGHYRRYAPGDALLHSEFGVDGASALKSLQRFLGPNHRQPRSMDQDLVWRHHGEWWDTYGYVQKLFGEPTDLPAFVRASQWIQAEGLRFICEANRRRQPRNCGSIIWQFNEPWPNVSCTNLVDYYCEQKPAYYYLKRVFGAFHVSLAYCRLVWAESEEFSGTVHVHANAPGSSSVKVEVLASTGNVLSQSRFTATLTQDCAVQAGTVQFAMPSTEDGLVWLRLTAESGNLSASNTYLFSTRPEAPLRAMLELSGKGLTAELLEDSGEEQTYRLTNRGLRIAPHVHMDAASVALVHDDAWFALLPGECRVVRVRPVAGKSFGQPFVAS